MSKNRFYGVACVAMALSASALAQGGPPAAMFAGIPNAGGTLYLTFCTAVGWPCKDFKQEVFGQICYGQFAKSYAQDHGGDSLYTRYSGWKCPGFVAGEEAKKYGYSDGGPADQ
jgi:hypothetical protein